MVEDKIAEIKARLDDCTDYLAVLQTVESCEERRTTRTCIAGRLARICVLATNAMVILAEDSNEDWDTQ